jgi:hypothetical protein
MNRPPIENGGAERDRTADPLLAKQVLSQLSYSPLKIILADRRDKVVGLGRFELPTSPLSGVRSNQLSYRPDSTAKAQSSMQKIEPARRLLCRDS